MNQKGFINILLIVVVVALVGWGAYFALNRQTQKPLSPVIERISPPEALIGAEISITGSGFTATKNSLQFGSGFAYINDLVSSDGKMITFTLPESFDGCNPDGVCADFLSRPFPGQMYEVAVINANGRSNSVNFTVAREEGPPTPTPTPSPTPTPTPTPIPSGEKIIRKVGERESSFLIQKINPDSVDGLWHQAYPVSQPEGTPRILRIGDDIGYACEGISEKLTSIDFSGQRVTFTKVAVEPPYGGCPICLAANTIIDTPSGSVLVKDLQVGMPIWTTNKAGRRVSGFVIQTSRVSVPPTHQMVHLVLDDGRDLFVSPGHPTANGHTIGDLAPNDLYDGARVVTSDRVIYGDAATYDILPSGETGFYWANGILLDSTLHGIR